MSIREKLTTDLDSLVGQQWNGQQPLSVAASNDRCQAEFLLTRVESIACEVWQLNFADTSMAAITTEDRTEIAKRISDHVKYLPEPLMLVESCDDGTILRSVDPPEDENGIHYLELTIAHPCSLMLAAYQGQNGRLRERRGFELTRDLLGRLIDDIERLTQLDEA